MQILKRFLFDSQTWHELKHQFSRKIYGGSFFLIYLFLGKMLVKLWKCFSSTVEIQFMGEFFGG